MSKLLNIAQVCDHFGISRWTLHRWRKQSWFPPSVTKYGSPRWNPAEIEAAVRQIRDENENRVANCSNS